LGGETPGLAHTHAHAVKTPGGQEQRIYLLDTGVLKKEVLWRDILTTSGYVRVSGTTTAMAAWLGYR